MLLPLQSSFLELPIKYKGRETTASQSASALRNYPCTIDWDKFQESLLFYTSVGKVEEKLVNMLF